MNSICTSFGHDYTARRGDDLVCVRCALPQVVSSNIGVPYDALAFRDRPQPTHPKSIT